MKRPVHTRERARSHPGVPSRVWPGAVALVPLALGLGIASNFEGLAMSLMLPVWRKDVKTLGAAWVLRREMVGTARTRQHAFFPI